MHTDFLLERFRAAGTAPALVWRDREYGYDWLLHEVGEAARFLERERVPEGAVIALEADFSPRAVAMLLALIERNAVLVPLTSSVESKKPEFREIAEVECRIVIGDDDTTRVQSTGTLAAHPLIRSLKERRHPGLILFPR